LPCVTGPESLAGEAPPQDLATRVHGIWVGFAKDGRLDWPEYEAGNRMVYQLEQGRAVHEPVMPAARHLS
jgi:para-nitrobenzyl esterase